MMRNKKSLALLFTLVMATCAHVQPPPGSSNALKSITVTEGKVATRIVIEGTKHPNYAAVRLLSPPRILVDIAEGYKGEVKPVSVKNGFINTISTTQLKDDIGAMCRVEIGLDRLARYDVTTKDNMILVDIFKYTGKKRARGTTAQAVAGAEEELLPPAEELPLEGGPAEEMPGEEAILPPSEAPPAPAPSAEAPLEAAPPPIAAPPAAPPSGEKASKMLDMKAETADNRTKVTITANGVVGDYNAFKLTNPTRLVVDVWNVGSLIEEKEIEANTPQVSKVRVGQHPDKVRFTLDSPTEEFAPYNITKVGNTLVLEMGEGVAPMVAEEIPPPPAAVPPEAPSEAYPAAPAEEIPPPPAEAPPPPTAPPPPPPSAPPEVGISVSPPPSPVVEVPPEAIGYKRRYTGRKISLEFKDADIHNILRLIAEVSNKNVIAAEDVTGKVTVRMINVPWDQALDVVLETKGLGKVSIGNIIRIAPAEKLRKEEEERLTHEEAKRKLEDLVTKIVQVNYSRASDVSAQVKGFLTPRGSVSVDDRTNSLIIKDVSRNTQEAIALVRTLDTPTPQVLIEARIVEATDDFSRSLGVQWGGRGRVGADYGNATGLYFPNSITAFGASGTPGLTEVYPNYAVNFPAPAGATAGSALGFVFGSLGNAFTLDLRLSALESQGKGKVISSPRVATLDNNPAKIQQGLSIPFETVSAQGTQTQFIDAVLSLEVTPHITADRSVIMKIKAAKNSPNTSIRSVGGVPSIDKKEATTEVLVKNGETTVIGGIFQITQSESRTGVPLLSKIPLIGWLFRVTSKQESKTELLVFITPRIIERSASTL